MSDAGIRNMERIRELEAFIRESYLVNCVAGEFMGIVSECDHCNILNQNNSQPRPSLSGKGLEMGRKLLEDRLGKDFVDALFV